MGKIEYINNFKRNYLVLKKMFLEINYKKLIFPTIAIYTIMCNIYNYAIIQTAWNYKVQIPKELYFEMLIKELSPLFAIFLVYIRVFAKNNLSLKLEKLVDVSVYAFLCFFSGYFYAMLKLNFTKEQEVLLVGYIFSLFLINILLSLTKEYNIKFLSIIFCINTKTPLFFKGKENV